MVQHAINVAETLFRAEGLGQFHPLVDDHARWHVVPFFQLEGADAQDGAFNGVQVPDGTIQIWREEGVQRIGIAQDAT